MLIGRAANVPTKHVLSQQNQGTMQMSHQVKAFENSRIVVCKADRPWIRNQQIEYSKTQKKLHRNAAYLQTPKTRPKSIPCVAETQCVEAQCVKENKICGNGIRA